MADADGKEASSSSDASADSTDEQAPGADASDAGEMDGEPEDATPDALDAETHDAGPDAADAGADAALDAEPDASEGSDASGAHDAPVEACTPIPFFLDGDGDGYGGTTSTVGCVPPDAGTWVTVGGDCDDSNVTVNPGQAAYFATGYVPTGKTSVSFDYDCDGQETESGAPAKASCVVF